MRGSVPVIGVKYIFVFCFLFFGCKKVGQVVRSAKKEVKGLIFLALFRTTFPKTRTTLSQKGRFRTTFLSDARTKTPFSKTFSRFGPIMWYESGT